jgi:hypothetical protein
VDLNVCGQQQNASCGCQLTGTLLLRCSSFHAGVHDLCGYWLQSAPDHYVNEAWFGLNSVVDCHVSDTNGGHRMSALQPRPIYNAMIGTYGGVGGADAAPKSCAELQNCWTCSQAHTPAAIATGSCNDACNLNFVSTTTPTPGGSTGVPGVPVGGGGTAGTSSSKGAANSALPSVLAIVLLLAVAALMQ